MKEKLKIGNTVFWMEKEYWTSKHPDESGYELHKHFGSIINFDNESVVIQECGSLNNIRILDIFKTDWCLG